MGLGRVQARTTLAHALGRAALVALTLLVLAPLAASATTSPAAAAGSPGRPNVVMLMIDDLTLEQYQHWMPKTRARLEPTGTTYDDSVVSFSECCPSRATFFTGQYAHNHGVLSGNLPTGGYTKLDHTNTLPVWLHDAGYYTAQIGKYMNGYGADAPPDIPPGWDNWFTLVDPSTQFFWDYTVDDNGTLRHYGTTAADYRETVETNRAVQTIDQVAGQNQPFFLDFNPSAPHVGFPNAAAYSGQGLEQLSPSATTGGIGYYPPPSTDGSLSGYTVPHTPDFNEADVSDKPAFRQLAPLTSSQVATVDNWYRKSSELVKALDDNIAAIIDELQAKGVLDNTLIMFTSDNGVFFGEHRIATGKEEPYEPSVQVPLVVRGPGFSPGVVEHRPVVNVDLNPTIMAATGATARLVTDGRALQALAADPAVGVDRPILLETGPLWGRRYYRGLRTKRWKYIEYTTGERELYDLVNDPYELQNLADQPARAADQLALHNLLLGMRACKGATCEPARGVYATRCTGPASDGVYAYTYVDGVLHLGSVSVTAVDRTAVVGDPVPAVDFSVVGADPTAPISPPTCAVVGPEAPAVGSHPTRCTGPASDANYDYTYVDGALTVDRAAVKVQASSPTMTFGDPVPTVDFTVSGAVDGFPPAVPTCGADPVVDAGSVATRCAGPASDATYDYAYVDGVLSVDPEIITVQASSATMTFGDPVPAITYTVDRPAAAAPVVPLTCSAPVPTGVGVVATSCSGLGSDRDHVYRYLPGVLTVLPRPVTITAGSGTIALGDPVPTTGFRTDGREVVGTPVSAPTCSVASGTGVGDRPTTCTGPVEDLHYRYSYLPGVLSVTRASITVMATSPSSTFGQPIPPVAGSDLGVVAGFVPAASTCAAAVVGLPVPGSYPTTCDGPASDENYDYHYLAGTLTVTRAPTRVIASSPTIVVGQPTPTISATVTGTVSGTPAAPTPCATVAPKGAGTSPTACTGPSSDAFYTYTYVGGLLTVQRAATTTTLSTSVDSAPVGQTVTLRAVETVVAPGQAPFTAAVEFFDGSSLVGAANVVAGQATLSLPSLSIGQHTFTAAYREGSDLQGSTSTLVPVSVVKASTAMALTASTTSAAFGQLVTLNATISVVAPGVGSPGSSVVFSDGTTSISVVASAGGRATLTTGALSVGTHTLTATYLEGAKFQASTSAPVIVTVARATTSTSVTLSPSVPLRGQPVTLTVTVAAVAPAVGVPGASITIYDGLVALATVVPAAGTTTFTTTLSAGSHSITARYAGGANFAPSASTTLNLTV